MVSTPKTNFAGAKILETIMNLETDRFSDNFIP